MALCRGGQLSGSEPFIVASKRAQKPLAVQGISDLTGTASRLPTYQPPTGMLS
jgi:hypothetical protein